MYHDVCIIAVLYTGFIMYHDVCIIKVLYTGFIMYHDVCIIAVLYTGFIMYGFASFSILYILAILFVNMKLC